MYTTLRAVRAFALGLIIWKLVGLLPVLSWLANPSAITTQMWVSLIFQLAWLSIGLGIFYGSKRLINYLHRRKHGVNHPDADGPTYDPAAHRPAGPPPADLWSKK